MEFYIGLRLEKDNTITMVGPCLVVEERGPDNITGLRIKEETVRRTKKKEVHRLSN